MKMCIKLNRPMLCEKVNFLIVEKETRKIVWKVVPVPVLPLTELHAMKAYWGSGGTAPPIPGPWH
jgi:hypothetical protein